mmetsp:Transcript_1758/g.1484  ORF Transcript_1758/g.1484 Transcript_1758/m.1484 type:complete len:359 (+) Transcript_1758:25-1101(+)
MVTNLSNMSHLHTILLFITIGFYHNAHADTQFDCKVTLNHTKGKVPLVGTYDLCDFALDGTPGYYAAYDPRDKGNYENVDDSTNYTYYFNIAANVASQVPDEVCDDYDNPTGMGYCKDITSEGMYNATCLSKNLVPIRTWTAAYQARGAAGDREAACWRLHDGVTPPIWTFLDDTDPALGIQALYTNGDWCAGGGKNREFKMQFVCANDVAIRPDTIQTIYEPVGETCSYEFIMQTYKGCPTECIVENEQLCGGHGVCDYDWQLQKPKCFCFNGYYGPGCLETADPDIEIVYQDSDNSYVGALVVVILLLLVILFILGYLFLRYTRVKNQPFDFKFLQQAKKRRGNKVSQSDEYAGDD